MPFTKKSLIRRLRKESERINRGEHGVSEYPLEDFGRKPVHFRGLVKEMEKNLGFFKNKKILQIGASTGIFMRMLQEVGAKAIPLDISERATKYSKDLGNVNTVRGEIKFLPFKSNSMDAIVSDHFLSANYALVKDVYAIKKIHRVLKPGGYLFLERAHNTSWSNLKEQYLEQGFEIVSVNKIQFRGKKKLYLRIVLRKKEN